jgi:iron(III) transport system ATP-binding protein
VASLELRGLTKSFGQTVIVDSMTLRLDHGRMLCLLGPSGCGKTTTLRLIAGFNEPTAGEIYVGEKLLSSPARTVPPEQRNMSMIFQSYALWPHMTVAENVAYGLKLRKLDRDAIARRLNAMLATARLGSLAGRYPGELSGGQQQRVAIARALVVEPETLLLDEPLSNLDANLREEMRFELRRLHDRYHYTTVYVTHDQADAMTSADLIAVMNAGRIEQVGTPEDIYDRPRSEFVARFIGSSNIVRGKNLDGDHIAFGGIALRCAGAALIPGGETPVSIRQHDIRLYAARPAETENVIPVTVTRQVFLGDRRDYRIEVPGGTELRVAAAADHAIEAGAAVWAHIPADRVRALRAGA